MEQSYILGKKFYESEWGNEKMRVHSECVIDACLGMTRNTTYNKDIFIIAGWIHDLGKKIDKDTHHEKSMLFLDKFLDQHQKYESLKPEISDCILNHSRRSDGNPKTEYGVIMKIADKVALSNQKWLDYISSKK